MQLPVALVEIAPLEQVVHDRPRSRADLVSYESG